MKSFDSFGREIDIDDMLRFGIAFSNLKDDEKTEVRFLIDEDFGKIHFETMVQVQILFKANDCRALDDLLEEFFTWHEVKNA